MLQPVTIQKEIIQLNSPFHQRSQAQNLPLLSRWLLHSYWDSLMDIFYIHLDGPFEEQRKAFNYWEPLKPDNFLLEGREISWLG